MKRQFLEALGIEKETIDKILDENGQEVAALNARIRQKDTEIATLRSDLTQSNTDLANLKKEDIEAIKAELQAEKDARAKDKLSFTVTNILAKNGCTDTDYIKYKMGDVETDENGNIKNETEWIKKLKETYPGFFNTGAAGGTGSNGNFARTHAAGKTPDIQNPYTQEGWNVTKQYALEIQDPEKAKQLQLEAGYTNE